MLALNGDTPADHIYDLLHQFPSLSPHVNS